MQGGLVLDSEKREPAGKGQNTVAWQARVLQPYYAVAAQLQELFSGGLLATTLLLQFIWFTNALAYYGLVLLTTSVSTCLTAFSFSKQLQFICVRRLSACAELMLVTAVLCRQLQ